MSDYVRTRGGLVIHRSECSFIKLASLKHEWLWAEGMGPQRISREFRDLRLPAPRFCKHCIGEIAA
jgi:hypothetical protein